MKEDLVFNLDNILVVSSRKIAIEMDRRHNNILSKIDCIIKNWCVKNKLFSEDIEEYFITGSYIDSKGETRKEYLLTQKGIKLYIDNCRKSHKLKNVVNIYNTLFKNDINTLVLTSRFEESFIVDLGQTLDALDINMETQKYIDKYKIDIYLEEYKIAIEYDEAQHDTSTNIILDKERENKISELLGCTFVRCHYSNTNAYNIGLVVKEIMKSNK